MIVIGNEIIPDEGLTLTNGETYSKHVYLGKWDAPENWHEIPDENVPESETTEDKFLVLSNKYKKRRSLK